VAYLVRVVGKDKLYKLSVMLENVDPHHRLVQFFACAVDLVEVLPFFIIQKLKA
jgi:hypothetical protein